MIDICSQTENRTRGNGTESPFLELKFLPNAPQHAGLYPTAIPTVNCYYFHSSLLISYLLAQYTSTSG